MIKKILPYFLIIGFVACQSKNEIVFQSELFTINASSVTEGEYSAKVISSTEIQSNYPGSDEVPFDSTSKKFVWKLSEDISNYPTYQSEKPLIDALYKLSLEELEKNKTADGLLYNTGAKWEGVWTRDVSYSFLLSLAYISPDIAKRCLLKKVKNGMIVQDTGSGGAWPVSTDRMTWVLAAWEIYKVTGEREWLELIYPIIKKSIDADNKTIYYENSLALGESSFLDWREQTYPRWMAPVDIYRSANLGTNCVHYQSNVILASMAQILGESSEKYSSKAAYLKTAINAQLWMADKGYYAQFRYGKHYQSLSPKSEALGEALSILFDIADDEKSKLIISNTPVVPFGTPCIYPQIPDISPYHNNGIWPFVQSYWNMACAKTKNEKALQHGLASIYRAAGLYLTNKENMVAESGTSKGTAINSDRQLWSVSGNIAMIYRIFAGMHFEVDRLNFSPVVLKEYGQSRTITNFKYREAVLNIQINGFGTEIKSFAVNGVNQTPEIMGDLKGEINIVIQMANDTFGASKINLLPVAFSPNTPKIKLVNNILSWDENVKVPKYQIFKNGEALKTTNQNNFEIDLNNEIQNFSEKGYIELSKSKNTTWNISFETETEGEYLIQFSYANGSGRMCCTNKCGIRTLSIDKQRIGTMVFPILEEDNWSTWALSNSRKAMLTKGTHTLQLTFEGHNENMNVDVNRFLIDHVVVTQL
jgi:hypothetical protein